MRVRAGPCILHSPDVTVTNQSDKVNQLVKLKQLSDEARRVVMSAAESADLDPNRKAEHAGMSSDNAGGAKANEKPSAPLLQELAATDPCTTARV